MKYFTSFILILFFSIVRFATAEKPDHEIVIGTRHGQLRFSPEVFAVKPDTQVKLILDNSDEMIHNLVLAKGSSKEIERLLYEGSQKISSPIKKALKKKSDKTGFSSRDFKLCLEERICSMEKRTYTRNKPTSMGNGKS